MTVDRITFGPTSGFMIEGIENGVHYSDEFGVGSIYTRTFAAYKGAKEDTWFGVITAIVPANQAILTLEFKIGSGYGGPQIERRLLLTEEIVDRGIASVNEPMEIATQIISTQRELTDLAYKKRADLEAIESVRDLFEAIFVPFGYEAREAHRRSMISPAESAEAIIADMVAQGMLPLDEQARDARRQMNLENGEEVTK